MANENQAAPEVEYPIPSGPMPETFNKTGTSLKEKMDTAAKLLAQAEANIRIAFGLKGDAPITDTQARAMGAYYVARSYRDLRDAQFRKQEAERKAREEAARKAAALQAAVAEIAAKLGTTDPEKILAAFRAAVPAGK